MGRCYTRYSVFEQRLAVPASVFFRAILLSLLTVSTLGKPAVAAEVHVAVAANFAAPMQRIARAFEEQTGHRALIALGATGALYAQARHGAPYGVFLAADETTPRRLETDGLGVPGTRFTYAVGRLVLWSPRPGLVDDAGGVLREGRIQRLALANPKLAPYGAAAVDVMTRLGVLEALRPRLVQGENIAQAYHFVASGNAELGFVALSQVQTDGRITAGSAWLVPQSLHAPLRQDAILLAAGRDNPAARALLEFLRGETARALIRAHGYEL
jgi:molybdate transport system substrate-binding protein